MKDLLYKHGVVTALIAVYLGFSAILIPIATDDIRLADVFSVDESGAAAEIRHYHSTGRLDQASFKYGSLFYYIPLTVLHVYGLVGGVTDRVILIVLRSFGALSGAGCLLLTYLLGRRLYDQAAGCITVAIVAVSAVFLRWSIESHPDLPQMLFVVLFLRSLLGVIDRPSYRSVAWSGILAAFAFNTKYAGLFLLPVLTVVILLMDSEDPFALRVDRLRDPGRWKRFVVAIGAALLAAAVTNPYAVLKYDVFVQSLQGERAIMSFGHTYRAEGGWYRWGLQLWDVVGWGHLLIAVAAAVQSTYRRHRPSPIVVALILWIVGYYAYLSLFSQLIRPRHVLPIIPAIAILVGGCYRQLWDASVGRRAVVLRAAIAVVFASSIGWSAPGFSDLVVSRLSRQDGQAEIVAGRWLSERYPPATSVLYDAYGYVPGTFQHVARSFGLTYNAIEHFRPRLLLVRDAIATDYADTSLARDSRVGESAFLDSHYFYRYLREHRLAYREVRDFGTVAVYEADESIQPRDVPWKELVKMFGFGKVLGVRAARRTMTNVHISAGNMAEADRQRRLSERAPSHVFDRFTLARDHLRRGEDREAARLVAEVVDLIASAPDSFRAVVTLHVARAYFETSHFEQAAEFATRAVNTFDGLDTAHFERGVFYLATGETARSDSILRQSVRRFGRSPQAKSLLEQLVEVDIRPKEARRALETHFGEVQVGR